MEKGGGKIRRVSEKRRREERGERRHWSKKARDDTDDKIRKGRICEIATPSV